MKPIGPYKEERFSARREGEGICRGRSELSARRFCFPWWKPFVRSERLCPAERKRTGEGIFVWKLAEARPDRIHPDVAGDASHSFTIAHDVLIEIVLP